MFKDLFSNRRFLGALAFFVLCVVGSLLYMQHVEKQSAREFAETPERIKVLTEKQNPKPTAQVPVGETSQGGDFHADGDPWHDEAHREKTSGNGPVFGDTQGINLKRTSSPLPFKDDIPQYLQMPPEWENWYYMEAYEDPTRRAAYEQRLETIAKAVVQDYNPNRPLEEVWPLFIAAERQFMVDSPYDEQNSNIPAPGGYRADWLYQQIWDFPEVFEVILSDKDNWIDVFHVELGFLEPDWNLFHLHDGREFRTKDKYKYEFVSEYNVEQGNYAIRYEFGLADRNAEHITVNLDTISPAEFQRIQGLDYNINPYTGKPISR